LTENSEIRGRIVRTHEDGIPILWSFVPEMPPDADRKLLPWMIVISWKYDGSQKNGMPDPEVNERMKNLDTALGDMEAPGFCWEAYRRIGNGLREFVLYASSCDAYMSQLNRKLDGHPRYPIEIKFYDDEDWSEFRQLVDDLGAA
jgi:hypothetical protein